MQQQTNWALSLPKSAYSNLLRLSPANSFIRRPTLPFRDKNKYSMRIFLFTDQDNPHSDDHNLRDKALNQANQLREIDVQIELFPLRKLDKTPFDIKKFYMQIISFDLDEINDAAFDQTQKI